MQSRCQLFLFCSTAQKYIYLIQDKIPNGKFNTFFISFLFFFGFLIRIKIRHVTNLFWKGCAMQLTFDELNLSFSAVTSFYKVFSRGTFFDTTNFRRTGTDSLFLLSCHIFCRSIFEGYRYVHFFLSSFFVPESACEFCLFPQNSRPLFRVHITTLLCIWSPPLPPHFLSLPLFFVSWALRGGQKFPPSKK